MESKCISGCMFYLFWKDLLNFIRDKMPCNVATKTNSLSWAKILAVYDLNLSVNCLANIAIMTGIYCLSFGHQQINHECRWDVVLIKNTEGKRGMGYLTKITQIWYVLTLIGNVIISGNCLLSAQTLENVVNTQTAIYFRAGYDKAHCRWLVSVIYNHQPPLRVRMWKACAQQYGSNIYPISAWNVHGSLNTSH